ncbi:hypothetical protein [Phaeobacter sp. B1627]|uniref:hypothetical protein n=1 Tax=Phaeobacter sp. B1627 TaxID=2583809 RepID=UPI00159EF246|nr:hypothetical protein [Phaeobacter sp. B1627]
MAFFRNSIWTALFGLSVSVGAGGGAQAEVWLCDFKAGTRFNTIPEKVLFDLRPDGTAMVMDPFLVHFEQAPKLAKFVKNTTKNLRVRWVVQDVEFQGGLATDMHFSVVHDKHKNKAFITLNLPSFDNRDSGTGTCAARK